MSSGPGNVYYKDYLELDKILSAQNLKSVEHGKLAHDEMLFVITHQAYVLRQTNGVDSNI